MMEEEFYSTIKLTSGEEIISKVCYLPDEDSILLDHPLKVEKVNQRKHGSHSDGFTLTEWINSTYETMFVIHRSSIITMSELISLLIIMSPKGKFSTFNSKSLNAGVLLISSSIFAIKSRSLLSNFINI